MITGRDLRYAVDALIWGMLAMTNLYFAAQAYYRSHDWSSFAVSAVVAVVCLVLANRRVSKVGRPVAISFAIKNEDGTATTYTTIITS